MQRAGPSPAMVADRLSALWARTTGAAPSIPVARGSRVSYSHAAAAMSPRFTHWA